MDILKCSYAHGQRPDVGNRVIVKKVPLFGTGIWTVPRHQQLTILYLLDGSAENGCPFGLRIAVEITLRASIIRVRFLEVVQARRRSYRRWVNNQVFFNFKGEKSSCLSNPKFRTLKKGTFIGGLEGFRFTASGLSPWLGPQFVDDQNQVLLVRFIEPLFNLILVVGGGDNVPFFNDPIT